MKTLRLASSLLLAACLLVHSARAQWSANPSLNTKIRDTAGYSATETKVATAPNGNSYIVWSQSTSNGYKLRLQLVDAAGYNLWNSEGLLLDSLLGSALYRFDIKVDNEGNAIVANQDQRSGTARWPVVFKVNQAGTSLWGTSGNGIQLTDTAAAATSGLSPVICVTDSNNVLVAWTASGSKTYISYQKISAAGSFQWTRTVLDPANTNTKKYERPKMVLSSGETFIMQYVSRTGSGLGVSTMFAQKFDGSGTAVWAAPTQVSTKTIGFAYFPEPVSDGYGGFFLSFTGPNPSSAAISAVWGQRVYSDGHAWNASGNVLYLNGNQQSFESGSAFVPSQNKYFAGLRVTSNSQGQAGLWLQRIDTAGNLELTATGYGVVPLSGGAAADIVYGAGMQPAGNGIIFLYYRGSSLPSMPIISKKTYYDGTPAWVTDTAVLSNAASSKSKITLGAYAHHQVVAAWTDNRLNSSGGGVYAQNVLNQGTLGNYPCGTAAITPASLPVDTIGGTSTFVIFNQSGLSGPLTWEMESGTLPAGIVLNPGGTLTGTATAPFSGSITIRVTDTNFCAASQTYTFTVVCPVVALAALTEVCSTDPAFALSGGTPAGGSYSGTGVSGGTFDPAVAGPGTFAITYVHSAGSCTDSAVQNITVKSCPTSVPRVAGGLQASCYPNPAGERLTVSCAAARGGVSVRILTAEGRVVALAEGAAGARGYVHSFDLRACARGIYQVVLRCESGTAVQRVLLQ